MNIILLLAPLLAIGVFFAQIVPAIKSGKNNVIAKKYLKFNIFTFFGVALILVLTMLSSGFTSMAATAQPLAEGRANDALLNGLKYFAAALSTGIGSLAAAKAVSCAVTAAIGAFSENDKLFGKVLIFVVLGEGLALYGFVISFFILNSK